MGGNIRYFEALKEAEVGLIIKFALYLVNLPDKESPVLSEDT